MNATPNIDMLEATRLTREGRLAEAMAVLRGELPGANPSTAPSDAGGDASKRPSGHFSRIIDMVPHPPEEGHGPRQNSKPRILLLTRLTVLPEAWPIRRCRRRYAASSTAWDNPAPR
jgi:hypothetical protein